MTADKLFLFSAAEIVGDDVEYSASGEGSQYPYFADAANRIKKRRGDSCYWWLRSPYVTNTHYFRCVNNFGSVYYYIASYSYGVSFGFCDFNLKSRNRPPVLGGQEAHNVTI